MLSRVDFAARGAAFQEAAQALYVLLMPRMLLLESRCAQCARMPPRVAWQAPCRRDDDKARAGEMFATVTAPPMQSLHSTCCCHYFSIHYYYIRIRLR